MSYKAAITVKDSVQKKMEEERRKKETHLPPKFNSPTDVKNVHAFERALDAADGVSSGNKGRRTPRRAEHYISDDETTTYDDR